MLGWGVGRARSTAEGWVGLSLDDGEAMLDTWFWCCGIELEGF